MYKFTVNGVEYTEDVEVAHNVTPTLFSELSIGNATSAVLNYQGYLDDVPDEAEIRRFIEVNGEWKPAGVFFLNTKTVQDELWTIEAVDAMRKAAVPWVPSQDLEFPMPMDEAVQLMAEVVGIEIDPRSQFESKYTIDYPTENYTIRDHFGFIAAAHGGNMIITPEGKLRLVRMYGEPNATHSVGDDYVSLTDNGTWPPVSRVTLMRDSSNGVTSGDDTGTEIVGTCFSATQDMADDILRRLKGIQYRAYECSAPGVPPTVELGDVVEFDLLTGIVAQINDDGQGYPSLSAPGQQEIQERYPDDGPLTAEMRRELKSARAELTKSASEIQAAVSGLKSDLDTATDDLQGQLTDQAGKLDELEQKTSLTVTQEQVEIIVSEAVAGVDSVTTSTGFKFDDIGMTISSTESEFSALARPFGFYIKRGEENVMVADNNGVEAINLTVNKYLSIGGLARLEPYGIDRVGCFWIGG